MKIFPAALFCVASLASQSSADSLNATVTIQSTASTNATIMETCFPPVGFSWYYNTFAEGPYVCSKTHDTAAWSMLNSYRSGGTQNVHWKYTNDPNDSSCLVDWVYYSSNGQDVVTTVSGRTTFSGDTKRWCALPVYRPGGVQGKQWAYCSCY